MYERKDHFYQRAKKEGHASRAVYKLQEIQRRFKILSPGDKVLELGAAPGGWIKEIAKWVGNKGVVIACDLLPLQIPVPPNAQFFQLDFTQLATQLSVDPFDVILSDISPNLSGIAFRDTYQSYELAKQILELCPKWLLPKGTLAFKIFPSPESETLRHQLKNSFEQTRIFVPKATRKSSSEVYFIAQGYKSR